MCLWSVIRHETYKHGQCLLYWRLLMRSRGGSVFCAWWICDTRHGVDVVRNLLNIGRRVSSALTFPAVVVNDQVVEIIRGLSNVYSTDKHTEHALVFCGTISVVLRRVALRAKDGHRNRSDSSLLAQ